MVKYMFSKSSVFSNDEYQNLVGYFNRYPIYEVEYVEIINPTEESEELLQGVLLFLFLFLFCGVVVCYKYTYCTDYILSNEICNRSFAQYKFYFFVYRSRQSS